MEFAEFIILLIIFGVPALFKFIKETSFQNEVKRDLKRGHDKLDEIYGWKNKK